MEINPEKCIVLAEEVDEMSSLDKSKIEKKLQELENLEDKNNKESKTDILIAKSKIEALNSSFYEKI